MPKLPYQTLSRVLSYLHAMHPKSLIALEGGDSFFSEILSHYLELSCDTVDESTLRTTTKKDLILCVEAIEHTSKKEMKKLLTYLLTKHQGIFITCTRDRWDPSDFAELGKALFIHDPERIIVYLTNQSGSITKTRKHHLKQKVARVTKSSKTLSTLLRKMKRS